MKFGEMNSDICPFGEC